MLKLKPASIKYSFQSVGRLSSRLVANNVETTVDPSELEKFSRDAQFWWEAKYKALRTLNEIRVPFIMGELMNNSESQSLENKTILDVGCGGGVLSEALASSGLKVTGIDASKNLIDVAIQHSKINKKLKIKPTYICTTIEEHAIENANYYDRIVASEVIEHVNNKELFVKACVQALKPGGRIFFTCPNKTRLSQFLNIWFAENVINNPPKGTHEYDKFITPQVLELILISNGCNVEEVKGFALNMFTITWRWTRSKSLFYAMRAVKSK